MQSALIAEHGGLNGVRDRGLLESALARPCQKLAFGDPGLAELAAAYGFGLCRNHPCRIRFAYCNEGVWSIYSLV